MLPGAGAPELLAFVLNLGVRNSERGKPGMSGRQLPGVRMPAAQRELPGRTFKYSGDDELQVRTKRECLFTCLGRGESLYFSYCIA